MSQVPYLLRLTRRLGEGMARLPTDLRQRHAAFLRAAQLSDGGFAGRAGSSDLYYTAFALRGLAVLGELDARLAATAGEFLRQCLVRQASVVDFFSLLYGALLVGAAGGGDVFCDSAADWPQRVTVTLESFRAPDGGYGKGPSASAGSTYHSFLVGLCYEVLGRPVPRPQDAVRFLMSRRRDDGGFVEMGPMRRSGTNPTAAAVGLLQLISGESPGVEPDIRQSVIELLCRLKMPEGGYRANTVAPLPDLLSTFTAAWTLDQLGAGDRIDRPAVRRFVESLERPAGGFYGVLAGDECVDVEYSFYGLGALALLAL